MLSLSDYWVFHSIYKCTFFVILARVFFLQFCDVISKWEQAMKCLGQGKVEKQRVIKLTYKNRFVLGIDGEDFVHYPLSIC